MNLSSGAITNASGGLIQVNLGPGGPRFIDGSVYNEGEFQANVSVTFGGEGAVFKNTGSFVAIEGAKVDVRGRNSRLELSAGNFNAPAGVELRDSTLAYDGGDFTGALALFRSRMRVADSVTNGFEATFSGLGSAYEGVMGSNRVLNVVSGIEGTAVSFDLGGDGVVRGKLLIRSSSGNQATVNVRAGALLVAPEGVLETRGGVGSGLQRVSGNIWNRGVWIIDSPLLLEAQTGEVTNIGSLQLNFPGVINSAAGFVQHGGLLSMRGGWIYSPTNRVEVIGGRMEGSGQVFGRLANKAEVTLHQYMGVLLVRGSYEQLGSLLTINLYSAGGSNALMIVTNKAVLGGSLVVNHFNTPSVGPGDQYILMEAGSYESWFDDIRLPLLREGLHWHLLRDDKKIRITALPEPMPLESRFDGLFTNGVVEVTGKVGRRLRLDYSPALTGGWTLLEERAPFPAYLRFEVPPRLLTNGAGFIRMSLID